MIVDTKNPKISNITSDRDFFQAERNLNLLHTINDCFVTGQKIIVQDFKKYLFIHKVSAYKLVDAIFQDAKRLGYITVEKGSIVKASPLLHESIAYYEKAIEDYQKKNCSSISYFDVNCKFDEIIRFLKLILEIVKDAKT